ncbi:mitochondrial carrier domain-containing protein [Armillaria fumosa]|nr:mitochondrial carrier domain-containing protein [Armillaria fumosa]
MSTALVVLLLLPALAISLAVTVPFTGTLVRFRANYTPKSRIALDEENAPPTGFSYTYLGMARRVYRIEGWKGFFKGYGPLFFSFLCICIGVALFTDYQPSVLRGVPRIPPIGIVRTAVTILLSILLGVPYRVIVQRSMITPYKLSILRPLQSWNALLLPTLFPSGLLSATAIITVASTVVFGPIRHVLLTWSNQLAYPISNLPLALYYILAIVFTITITPLDMIATRLAVQGSSAIGEAEERSLVGETVVNLRDEQVEIPYTGMIDCATRIWDEEGWPVLYRGWWFTFLTVACFF